MSRPATLREVSAEQERIGVLLNAIGVYFIQDDCFIDLICNIEQAVAEQDRDRVVGEIYAWSMPAVPPEDVVVDLLHPDRFEWRWDDDSETVRSWFCKLCGGLMIRGHTDDCLARVPA